MIYIKLSRGSDKSMQVAMIFEYGRVSARAWRLNDQEKAATDVIPVPPTSFVDSY